MDHAVDAEDFLRSGNRDVVSPREAEMRESGAMWGSGSGGESGATSASMQVEA
jgi:hypothetical protein